MAEALSSSSQAPDTPFSHNPSQTLSANSPYPASSSLPNVDESIPAFASPYLAAPRSTPAAFSSSPTIQSPAIHHFFLPIRPDTEAPHAPTPSIKTRSAGYSANPHATDYNSQRRIRASRTRGIASLHRSTQAYFDVVRRLPHVQRGIDRVFHAQMPRRRRIEPAFLRLREEAAVVLHAQREFVEVVEQSVEVEELDQMAAQSAAFRAFSTMKKPDQFEPNAPLLAGEAEQGGHEGANASGVSVVHSTLRKKIFQNPNHALEVGIAIDLT